MFANIFRIPVATIAGAEGWRLPQAIEKDIKQEMGNTYAK